MKLSMIVEITSWAPVRALRKPAMPAHTIPPIIVAIVANQTSQDLARMIILFSPADVLDGVNAAIFGSFPDNAVVASVDLPGWAYLAAAVIGIAASIGLTVRRYLRIAT